MTTKAIQIQVFTSSILHMKDLGFYPKDGKKLPCVFFSPFFIVGVFMKIGLIGTIIQDYKSKHPYLAHVSILIFKSVYLKNKICIFLFVAI